MTKLIQAAGGLIIDPERKGRFLVVHRPKYDDWSLPKGKVRVGERAQDCALREVREETGLVCELLEELNSVTYTTNHANLKSVRFWLMQPIGQVPPVTGFRANSEVDAITWLKRSQALALLSHDYDHAVLIDGYRRVKELRKAQKRSRRAQAVS